MLLTDDDARTARLITPTSGITNLANTGYMLTPAGDGRRTIANLEHLGCDICVALKEAIPIYLGVGRRKQSNKDIAVGLQAGGFPTTAENFEATVATALYRLKRDGVLLRFPDGWDLASSYPDSLRNRLEKDAAPRKTRAKKGRKTARSKSQGTAKAEATEAGKPRIVVVKVPQKAKAEAVQDKLAV